MASRSATAIKTAKARKMAAKEGNMNQTVGVMVQLLNGEKKPSPERLADMLHARIRSNYAVWQELVRCGIMVGDFEDYIPEIKKVARI